MQGHEQSPASILGKVPGAHSTGLHRLRCCSDTHPTSTLQRKHGPRQGSMRYPSYATLIPQESWRQNKKRTSSNSKGGLSKSPFGRNGTDAGKGVGPTVPPYASATAGLQPHTKETTRGFPLEDSHQLRTLTQATQHTFVSLENKTQSVSSSFPLSGKGEKKRF